VRSLNREWAQRSAIVLAAVLFLAVRAIERWPEFTLPSVVASLESTTVLWGIALAIFLAQAWKWKMWRPWLVTLEDLGGCWTGVLRARREDGKYAPLPVVVEIRHALFRVSVTVWTQKSKSISYISETYRDLDNDEQHLAYCYRAGAEIEYRDGNERHDGAASLTLTGNGECLRGEYWTDRRTGGQIDLTRRTKDACPDPKTLVQDLASKAAAEPLQGWAGESA